MRVQGRYREGTGLRYRECTGKLQGRYIEGTGKVQGRYIEGTGKVQG